MRVFRSLPLNPSNIISPRVGGGFFEPVAKGDLGAVWRTGPGAAPRARGENQPSVPTRSARSWNSPSTAAPGPQALTSSRWSTYPRQCQHRGDRRLYFHSLLYNMLCFTSDTHTLLSHSSTLSEEVGTLNATRGDNRAALAHFKKARAWIEQSADRAEQIEGFRKLRPKDVTTKEQFFEQ